jgi:hypothetical protein
VNSTACELIFEPAGDRDIVPYPVDQSRLEGRDLMTRSISAFIMIALAFLCAQRSQAGYSARATAGLYYHDTSTPFDQDAHTAQAPVSVNLAASIGGTMATANNAAEFNRVHVKMASIGTSASNTPIQVSGGAEWSDSLFFKRNGADVLSGIVAVSGHVDGTIDAQGLGSEPVLPSNVWIIFDVGVDRGGSGYAYAGSGTFDSFHTSQSLPTSWTAANGLPITVSIYGFVADSEWLSSVVADFSSTAQIVDVAYLGPDGKPDPSVKITSASGFVYGVPEPSGWLLAIAGIASIVWHRRPRFG